MKEFIKKMISGDDDVSHKRVLSFLSFFVLVAIVVINAFDKVVNDTLIYVFGVLCVGQSSLSVIDKIFKEKEHDSVK